LSRNNIKETWQNCVNNKKRQETMSKHRLSMRNVIYYIQERKKKPSTKKNAQQYQQNSLQFYNKQNKTLLRKKNY